ATKVAFFLHPVTKNYIYNNGRGGMLISEKTKKWIKAASVRAVKTIAQTAVGMITVGAALNEVNWPYTASVAVVAGIISLLTSIAGLPEVNIEETEVEEDGNVE